MIEAISALVTLLEASPTDIEAWAELSDLYLSQGLYHQAVYCLEEILLLAPNAWNVCSFDDGLVGIALTGLTDPCPDGRAVVSFNGQQHWGCGRQGFG